ncbi:MAG: tRNA pseudouridine(38-40) synthase TruA [Anaerotardibacter sp.]
MAERLNNTMITFALTISYNGQPFNGYAKQPGQLTVQGSLEEALSLVFRQRIETVCSGRTDSGVHARGQIVSFSIPEYAWENRNEYKVLRSLNALTHESIAIKKIERKSNDFSARFSAVSREYRYFIATDPHGPLLMEDFSWHLGKKLDIAAMRKAARYLIGEHDFKSFCLAVSAERKPTHRYVASLTIEPYEVWGENLVCITIVGNAFLHSMVRTIVGTLVMVGLGKREPEWVKEVLEARSRSAAGENAPAQGLVFWEVNYTGKRFYDPNAKKLKEANKQIAQEENRQAPSNEKKNTAKARRGLSDVLADYIPHKGAEAEFVIPRGENREEGDKVFSEIKPEFAPKPRRVNSLPNLPQIDEELPPLDEMAPLNGAELANEAKPLEEMGSSDEAAYLNKEDSFNGTSAFNEVSPLDETGKLPLTLCAWDTGKLEPVTVANLKEGILPPSEEAGSVSEAAADKTGAVGKSVSASKPASESEADISKKEAEQAMNNLRELERSESKVFLKKIYPFQRK